MRNLKLVRAEIELFTGHSVFILVMCFKERQAKLLFLCYYIVAELTASLEESQDELQVLKRKNTGHIKVTCYFVEQMEHFETPQSFHPVNCFDFCFLGPNKAVTAS